MNKLTVFALTVFALSSFVCCFSCAVTAAADVEPIGPENRFPLEGKEADWIDGDYVLRNDQLIAVIARPAPTRDANMMVRGIGGSVIDLTRTDIQSDQLTCYYPTAARYQFFDDSSVEFGPLDQGGVFWRCRSSAAVNGSDSVATVEYQLLDGSPYLTVNITVEGESLSDIEPADGVRADRSFEFATISGSGIGYCEDQQFRQTYGLLAVGYDGEPSWIQSDRMQTLGYSGSPVSEPARSVSWTTRIYPASSAIDLWGLTKQAAPQTFQVTGAVGDQPRIKLSIVDGDLGSLPLPAVWYSADDGRSIAHLPPGDYRVRAEAIGHQPVERELQVSDTASEHVFQLGSASRVVARVTDEGGGPIPCKVTFYGTAQADGTVTPDPVFGIDSQSGSIGNCVYSADGTFTRSIPPGSYVALISRGPEYDVVDRTIEVVKGSEVQLTATLQRVIDTAGWVSAELHSHSSPSGDNTSEQIGRVENLLCEHLEFAPCTEHQRVESYETELEKLGATDLMATCSGMELTNRDGDLNHQNAFPLKWVPFTQGGGAPRTDTDPIAQISRLAMWDEDSDKVIQINHPDLQKMAFDRDLDGTPDGGFSKMFDYADIIEVHPIEDIFLSAGETSKKSRMRPWMELLKTGRRIPGVVNTDAHYNWHGSGSLRNWVRCSTDVPAEITTEEMIERLESGQIVMSTGPYMTVQLHHPDLNQAAEVGDRVSVGGNEVELAIKIQCANWLDVNRVEIFVSGERQPALSRTRRENSSAFQNGVVKFDQRMKVRLPNEDSFLIVAAIGERLQLGRVMGAEHGKKPPVVVSNPIYVNVTP